MGMRVRAFAEHRYWLLISALLAAMAALQIGTALQESPVWDESIHLFQGYGYLKRLPHRINTGHPVLGNVWNALPLLFLPIRTPRDLLPTNDEAVVERSNELIFGSPAPADTIVFRARLMTILLTLSLAIALAAWTKTNFGAAAGLFAVFLFAFDPNLLAHGKYVTTDMVVTLFIFLCSVSWARFLSEGRARHLVLAGILLGCALAGKLSGVLMVPSLLALYGLRWWQIRSGESEKALSLFHMVRSFAVLGALAVLTILAVYAYDPITPDPPSASGGRDNLIEKAYFSATGTLHLPAHRYMAEWLSFGAHMKGGHPAYLLGDYSLKGWWFYFPVVFAVKSSTALLLVLGAVFLLAATKLPPVDWQRLRRLSFAWFVPPVCAGMYFLLSMFGSINIGVRHILPVYPFIYALLGGLAFRAGPRVLKKGLPAALAAVILLVGIETYRIHPNYTAYFNLFAGGPAAGSKYLLDSNLDWGQDLKKLKTYVDAHRIQSVCLQYFGTALPAYYGIPARPLPVTRDLAGRNAMDCVAVISVTNLYNLYLRWGSYDWLRELTPSGRIGYSMYVYDLRKAPEARRAPGAP